MTEGPTTYPSLDRALQDRGIPLINHELIRRFTSEIRISAYFGTSGYIKAVRADGGPDLQIAYGWTNGFCSAEEAEQACGGLQSDIWPSDRTNLFGITHPENQMYDGRNTSPEPRAFGVCPVHNMALPATGLCDDCN